MASSRRAVVITAAATLCLAGVFATSSSSAAAAGPAASCANRVRGDINDDGHADVVVGQPNRLAANQQGIGAANVIRGVKAGLTTAGNQFVDESVVGEATDGGSFGATSAVGFFGSGCYADAVIGVPAADGFAGALVVIRGGAHGLDMSTAVRYTAAQLSPAGSGAADVGSALAVGDFNHDGFTDLAIGAALSADEAGAVAILYGSANGLGLTGRQWFTQDSPGVVGVSEKDDTFGASLAAGDFNGDHYTDLAIGAPGETINGVDGVGRVTILRGSAHGITGTGSKGFDQATAGVPGSLQEAGEFAYALAAGDINGDGRAELAVGEPCQSFPLANCGGAVTVFKGSSSGVTTSGIKMWDEGTAGVVGTARSGDAFGSVLSMGDYNGDGHADVATGMPGKASGSLHAEGAVEVLYGRSSGLSASGAQLWTQDSPGIIGVSEDNDEFGESLRSLDLTGSGRDALVIGVPSESSSGFSQNGAIAVLLGGSHGLTSKGNQFIDGTGLVGGAQDGAELGFVGPGDLF